MVELLFAGQWEFSPDDRSAILPPAYIGNVGARQRIPAAQSDSPQFSIKETGYIAVA
jgi:hypothetical protein